MSTCAECHEPTTTTDLYTCDCHGHQVCKWCLEDATR